MAFSVRIDVYRDPHKPGEDAGYVGSLWRHGFQALALPRVGERVHSLGPVACWRPGWAPYGVVDEVEHRPTPTWQLDLAKPEEEQPPRVVLVVRGEWPEAIDPQRAQALGVPSPGEEMLRDYDARGWELHFFSKHTPVEPFPGQPLMGRR